MTTYTQADFDRERADLEAHVAAIKRRRDLPKRAVDELVAEYLLVRGQAQALDRLMNRGCQAIWATRTPEARNVWRRANWHRGRTSDYLQGIRAELIARGEPGIAGIRRLFDGGDLDLTLSFARDAEALFPDEAEPVLEELLRTRTELPSWNRTFIHDLLTRIRGYRARGPAGLAPALAPDPAAMAPTLAPTPGTPTDFPDLLLARIATNVFTGRMGYKAAVIEAWAWVAEDRRLDPAEIDRAECAAFDFAIWDAFRDALWAVCADHRKQYLWPLDTAAVPDGLEYLDACDRPIPRARLVEVLWHARMAPDHPYESATSWRRAR